MNGVAVSPAELWPSGDSAHQHGAFSGTSCHRSCQRITGDWGCIWCRRVSGDISGQNYCGVTFTVAKVCISVHRHCHSSVQEIDNASGLLE